VLLSNVTLYWPDQRWSNGFARRASRRSTMTPRNTVGDR